MSYDNKINHNKELNLNTELNYNKEVNYNKGSNYNYEINYNYELDYNEKINYNNKSNPNTGKKYSNELKTKNITFKNRLIMPPMATAKADDLGHVTEDYLKYYEDKTKSGSFAAVIVEHSYVEKRGQAHPSQTSISKDSDIEGVSKLVNLIKANSSLAIIQLAHAGSAAKKEVTGFEPVGPSAVPNPNPNRKDIPAPRELSVSDIKDIEKNFIDAAIRSKKAGFDGVEIHSAHGYLLNQFLSPLSNKRTDEYGGDIMSRIKLHIDIIRGIKKELGDDYPVFIRMGAGDLIEGGLTRDDSVRAALEFEKAGVDVIDISGGMCSYAIDDTRAGYFDIFSKPIFDNVNVPVILTGGVKVGQDVVDILDRDVCDLVGIGRSVFKDSDWMERELGK